MGSAAAAVPARMARMARRRRASSRRLRRMRPAPGSFQAFLELHFRNVLAPRRGLEEGLLLEAAQPGDETGREHPHAEIVVAHRLVEALALHGNAVLRPLELALQGEEILVALELRITLDGDEKARERAPELILGILELLEGGRVVEKLRRGLDTARARAGPRHFLEDGALLGREALDRLQQFGNEV